LKGYSHQESILKTLEGKIKGYFINLPNLIFKKVIMMEKQLKKLSKYI
jgi:hypothetical protein